MRRALMALGVVTVSVVLGTGALSQTTAAGAQLALVGGIVYTGLTANSEEIRRHHRRSAFGTD